MALPTLESLTDALFDTADEILGDAFTLTPAGGSPITLRSHVDHSDRVADFGNTSAVLSDAVVEIRKTARAEILNTDIIHLPWTGLDYSPREIRQDRSGRYWVVELEQVAS